MTDYLFYLDNNSIVQASVNERDDHFIGSVSCDASDLVDLLFLMQSSVDAVIIQLAERANSLFTNKNNKSGDMN